MLVYHMKNFTCVAGDDIDWKLESKRCFIVKISKISEILCILGKGILKSATKKLKVDWQKMTNAFSDIPHLGLLVA